MISKNNSVLIFDPKGFVKNTFTDQNLTFPFKKHEIFGGVAHVSHMARKLTFQYDNMRFFFGRSGGQRIWFFMKKMFKKFCLTCSDNKLFKF